MLPRYAAALVEINNLLVQPQLYKFDPELYEYNPWV